MRLPGGSEWIIILVVVLLLFGPGRIGKIASELGESLRNFREGLGAGKNGDEKKDPTQTKSK